MISQRRRSLWALRLGGRRLTAELRPGRTIGWEMQVCENDVFRYAERHADRTQALAQAEHCRDFLMGKGWLAEHRRQPATIIEFPNRMADGLIPWRD